MVQLAADPEMGADQAFEWRPLFAAENRNQVNLVKASRRGLSRTSHALEA